MMKISSPRTFSSMRTNVSPSGKGVTVILPSSQPMDLQMARASGSLEVPENTFTGKNGLVKKENPPDAADESHQIVTTTLPRAR